MSYVEALTTTGTCIDQDTALVWFRPSNKGTAYETSGGLYLTVDGGLTWTAVPFDGDWDADPATTGDCTAYTTFKNGRFDIVHLGIGTGGSGMWVGEATW